MKKLILFIVLIGAMGLFTNNTAKSADRPYYLLFTNLEDKMGNGEGVGFPDANTIITNLDTLLYINPLLSRDEWKRWSLVAPFSPSTFAQYPISSFDFAIFPIEEKGLDYSVGGVKIMDKIQEMIDAGKDIIIIGRNWLRKASSDPAVNKFVTQTLGLIPEQVSLFDDKTNTYIGFDVFGNDTCTITQGGSMHYNGGYARNTPIQWPMRLYRDADMFTVKPDSKFFPFNRTVAFGGTTKYVGGYINIGQSTIAVYSMDWSNVAGSTTDATEYMYKALIERFLSDTPKPEQYLKSEFNEIDMGSCPTGDSLFSTCRIMNFGRKPLVISKIHTFRTDQTCFTIKNNPGAITLQPNEMKKLMVEFKPTEDGDFMDDIIIESNATNSSSQGFDIGLLATGGQKANYGPNLNITSYPIDFGKILTGKISFADVEITNTGQSDLVVDSISFVDKNQKNFIYADVYHMPQVIIPGNTYSLRIKFIPLVEDSKYSTKMRIESNGYNDLGYGKGIGYVTLIGETYSDKAGPNMTISKDELLFGQDSVKTDSTIIIRNTGDQDLLVQNPELYCDQENAEPFSFSPKEIPAIIPGATFKLTVSFTPPANKEYQCYLKLINNSTNPSMANMQIWLNGEGKHVHPISVNEGNNPDVMDIKVIPNPVTENSEIMLNIFDDSQRTLEISLIDMQGKEVKKIVNGIYSKGEYKFNLEKNNIATGKYLLIVKYGRDEQNISIIVK